MERRSMAGEFYMNMKELSIPLTKALQWSHLRGVLREHHEQLPVHPSRSVPLVITYAHRDSSPITGWANRIDFPPKSPVTPGFDPIIGQNINGPGGTGLRTMVGANPSEQSKTLDLPVEWVVPKGGEYFFSPSIPALRDTFALA